jgi:hypothetical protein
MSFRPDPIPRPTHPAPLALAAVFWFCCAILCAVSFVLTSCASTPAAAQRQLELNAGYSNQVARIMQAASAAPTPVTPVIELLGAVALAGLGVWNTYLHNQVTQVKNGNAKTLQGAPQPPPTPGT